MNSLKAFQQFVHQHIPLVSQMQLQLNSICADTLLATAPLQPNINDKGTVFGGSSSALMTICGWSLIKYHLEAQGLDHDVVIHRADTQWTRAQTDDLHIKAMLKTPINWATWTAEFLRKNRSTRIHVNNEVQNQQGQICTAMAGTYVVLKK